MTVVSRLANYQTLGVAPLIPPSGRSLDGTITISPVIVAAMSRPFGLNYGAIYTRRTMPNPLTDIATGHSTVNSASISISRFIAISAAFCPRVPALSSGGDREREPSF